MPANLSIKNVPDELAHLLRQRAERNHRSLQGELMAILEDAVLPQRGLTPGEVLERVRSLRLKSVAESAKWIREDRDR